MGGLRAAAIAGAAVAVPLAAATAVSALSPDPELPMDEIMALAKARGCDDARHPLRGLRVVITGATSGLGEEIASFLFSLGASVTLVGRSRTKLESYTAAFRREHADAPGELNFEVADLQDLDAVAAAAGKLRQRIPKIDFLVNNAGIHYGSEMHDLNSKLTSPQDRDIAFSANYLGHFLLTAALEPNLRAAGRARVVQVSSSYHWQSSGDLLLPTPDGTLEAAQGDLSGKKLLRQRWLSYCNSKLAQILHARALQRAWGDPAQGAPQVLSICPTWVRTEIIPQGLIGKVFVALGFPTRFGIYSFLKAALTPREKIGSDYVENCGARDWLPPLDWWVSTRATNATGLRDLLGGHLLLALLLIFQRLKAGARFATSSPESYNVKLQDALYKWSLKAVRPHLEALQFGATLDVPSSATSESTVMRSSL